MNRVAAQDNTFILKLKEPNDAVHLGRHLEAIKNPSLRGLFFSINIDRYTNLVIYSKEQTEDVH